MAARTAVAAQSLKGRRSSFLEELLAPTPKAYSYVRFSTPEQKEGDSQRRQVELAQKYADEHGLELDEELSLSDEGVSAYHSRNRRVGALRAFSRYVEDGIVKPGSYLLIESLDRLTRDEAEEAVETFLSIIRMGVVLVTLMDGKEYRKGISFIDLIYSLMMMMRGHEESATKAKRLRAVWAQKRSTAGEKPMTSMVPGWLKLNKDTIGTGAPGTFEVLEDRAAVVKRIFELALTGKGIHGIAKALNLDGVPTFGRGTAKSRAGIKDETGTGVKEKLWSRTYTRLILCNPAVIGTYIPHKLEHENGKRIRIPQEPIGGYYPAIVEKETWDRVQVLMNSRNAPLRGRHSTVGVVSNIFGGLAKCPLCGERMTKIRYGERSKYYLICTHAKTGGRCKYRTVRYDYVEAAFLKAIPWITAQVPAGDRGQDIDVRLERVEANISGAYDGIENLMEALQRAYSPILADKIRATQEEIDQLKEEREELLGRQVIAKGDFLEHNIDRLKKACSDPANIDKVQVNTLIRQLLDSIVVNYTTGVLELNWKHGAVSEIVYAWSKEE